MTVCIICLGEKKISEQNPLTIEHIIPEFIGGALAVKNVCKSCNSLMGDGFEGRLANAIEFQIPRYYYGIKGKNNNIPNPFSGNFYNEKLGKFSIKKDMSVSITPQVDFNESVSGIGFEIKVDKSDVNKVPAIVEKRLKRIIKSKGKDLSESELKEIAIKLVESAEIEHSINKQVRVKSGSIIDLNDHFLLYIKISYELANHHFGIDYILDPVANFLRSCLLKQQVLNRDIIFSPKKEVFGIEYDEEYHWVLFHRCYCFISIFGITSAVICYGGNLTSNDKTVVYKFDFKERNYKCYERRIKY